MIFAVDTNVLMDVLLKDEKYYEGSRAMLEEKSEEGFFVISPEVYSELVAAFSRKFSDPAEELDRFLEEKGIHLGDHNRKSLEIAGRKWKEYSASKEVRCPECGEKNDFSCEECGSAVKWRNHLITDFLIGSHAEEKADAVITRDEGYFSSYFETEVLNPAN